MKPDHIHKLAVIRLMVAFIVSMYTIYGELSRAPKSFSLNLETDHSKFEVNCEFNS